MNTVWIILGLILYCFGEGWYRLAMARIRSLLMWKILPAWFIVRLANFDALGEHRGKKENASLIWRSNTAHFADHISSFGIALMLVPLLSWWVILIPPVRGWIFTYWLHVGLDPFDDVYRWSLKMWLKKVLNPFYRP